MSKDRGRDPKALVSALSSLSRREHSAWELKKKLEQKGYNLVEIAQAVEECQRLGYQSDDRFVEVLYRARIGQGYGPVRIKQELEAKGIGAAMIEQVLLHEAEESWLERAVVVARKKCQTVAHLSWDDQQKLKRFLLYRGFPGSVIAGVFEKF